MCRSFVKIPKCRSSVTVGLTLQKKGVSVLNTACLREYQQKRQEIVLALFTIDNSQLTPDMKKKLLYGLFFGALMLGFYFMLTALIPGFGQRKVNPINEVKPFRFTNQDGVAVTNEDVKGKVYVAEYFFTTCPGICPMMNNNMRLVYDRFKDNPDFLILSHTCQPEVDSPAVLRHYADSMKVDTKRWVFLTGRKDSLYNMARLSYSIDDPANNLQNFQDDFMHTQFWALVDREGKVRKIYDGLKKAEVKELISDAEKFLKK